MGGTCRAVSKAAGAVTQRKSPKRVTKQIVLNCKKRVSVIAFFCETVGPLMHCMPCSVVVRWKLFFVGELEAMLQVKDSNDVKVGWDRKGRE